MSFGRSEGYSFPAPEAAEPAWWEGMKGLFPVLSTNISKSNPAGGLGLDIGQDATMGEGQSHEGMVPRLRKYYLLLGYT